MKKHLLAAAVAAAVCVPAAAQVSVSGNIDVNAMKSTKTTTVTGSVTATTDAKNTGSGADGTNATSQTGWATSELIFQATEDLGAGLKATARISQNISSESFASRDRYVEVTGGFGAVRLGRLNPFTADLNGYSGAGTTGSGGHLNDVSTGGTKIFGTAITSGSFERQAGLIQFTSPSFNGFTVNALYGDNSSDLSTTASSVTESKIQGLGATYAAGPLKIQFVSAERKNKTAAVAATQGRALFYNSTSNSTISATTNSTTGAVGALITQTSGVIGTGFVIENILNGQAGAGTPATASYGIVQVAGVAAQLATDATHEFDWVGASYDLGPATLMASHSRRTSESNSVTSATVASLNDSKVNSIGLMVPMGATTFRLSTYNGQDERGAGSTDDMKLSGHQVSATYSLSKRTMLYAVMGESDVKRDTSASTAMERKLKSNSFGLVHKF